MPKQRPNPRFRSGWRCRRSSLKSSRIFWCAPCVRSRIEVASGSVEAHEQQRRLLRDLGQQMRALPVGVWDDVRNVRSAIFFVLSGGDPAVLKLVIGRDARPIRTASSQGCARLWRGPAHRCARIDAENGSAQARSLARRHGGADPGNADRRKRIGQNALVYFNEARLLAPGTLVEESALRQRDHDFGPGWRSRKVRRPGFAVFAGAFRARCLPAISASSSLRAWRGKASSALPNGSHGPKPN